LERRWGFPRPLVKSHAEERVSVALGWGAPQNLAFPFNIYTMAEASDFKFDTQLGLATAHDKSTPRGKVDVALG